MPDPRRIHPAYVTVAVAILAIATAVILLTGAGPDAAPARAAACALAAVQVACLAWLGRRPERATAVSVAAGIAMYALGTRIGFLGLANLMLCGLAWQRPPRVSLWALGAVVVLSPWAAVDDGAASVLVAAGGGALSWTWGELGRTRRDRRRGEARRAVAEERARIARELHDVVAHNVSLIVVQAVAADDVFDAHPEQSRAALRAIESSGRAALAELRRLLHTVRPDDADDDGTLPQPGLHRLDALVSSVRAAGLDVRVHSDGEPLELPAGVDLSAYRIVQEALTNTLRHADATRADVTVRYTSTAVEVDVRDDGRGAPGGASGGQGIVGMRERAALVGGSLEVGAAPRGGFHVRAELPVGAPA